MKIAVLGGGSVRTPLLLRSLFLAEELGLDEVALYDTDQVKLERMGRVIARLEERYRPRARVSFSASPEAALGGADYIFSSFRPGGDGARVLDERVPLSLGELGQETVGAGGFSMALRSVPPSLAYAALAARICPKAWYVNFTNPSGIISQALLNYSPNPRVVGICDAPVAIMRIAAGLYGAKPEEAELSYFGLNHLGWAYSLRVRGEEKVRDVATVRARDFAEAEPLYRALVDHMAETGLVPNEYLLFYLHAPEIVAKLLAGGETRGEFVLRRNAELLDRLADPAADPVESYERYLQSREDGYMAKESGEAREPKKVSLFHKDGGMGYDDVAIMVIEALAGIRRAVLPVNVRNGSFCPWLEKGDVIEVSCEIGPEGPRPIGKAPELPARPVELIRRVKAYERDLARAAATGDRALAGKALAENPLVDEGKAAGLYEAILAAHREALAYLR
jgi:6-phospho-beta-glucosidase